MNSKHVILVVTGSVAAYKSIFLMRLLQKQGAIVRVVMTTAALNFVSKTTFAVLSKQQVYTDSSYFDDSTKVNHIGLAQWGDLMIVAPATADFIGKAANGIADDFALTTWLAFAKPKFMAPAMNDQMLEAEPTQKNLAVLKNNGVKMISSNFGELAEGYRANGRMAEPQEILKAVSREQKLLGKKVIVTAGGTREAIDPVRFIGNRSSGKMGFALAQAAAEAGADVTLVNANSNLPVPSGVKQIRVETAGQLQNAVLKRLPDNDFVIMAAAVSDFHPEQTARQKIKKDDSNDHFTLKLAKNPDILKRIVKEKKSGTKVVGFAAETNDLEKNAQKKLNEKQLDMIVANDVSEAGIGFDSDQNQVQLYNKNGTGKKIKRADKKQIAREIIAEIEKL